MRPAIQCKWITINSQRQVQTYTAGQDQWSLYNKHYSSEGSSNASFVTGRVRIPERVFTVATRTRLSLPGYTSVTRPKGHLVGRAESSRRITISPTRMFLVGERHLATRPKWVTYSPDHRFQKCRTKDWHNCQRLSNERELAYTKDESGRGLTDYRPRGHDVIRTANAEIYSRKYSDTNKMSCTA